MDDDDRVVGSRDLPPFRELARAALTSALLDLGSVDAVGHRIVHGGSAFTSPVLVDDSVTAALRALTDLAPLHQPAALDALRAVSETLPGVPAVACFDTAFHATLPVEASTYAIPQRWRDLGARRYGFHGLSHSWASRRATEMCGRDASARVVTCHLGGGASLAAVAEGRCIDTTMGFTPLDGLVMATRSGSLDPGLVLWLQQHGRLSADEVAEALEHDSGLFALCGSADMRDVTTGVDHGDPAAKLALGVFIHRLRAGIGSMVAALGGLDALVFTGGIGEKSPVVRSMTCSGLGFLGVMVDDDANTIARSDQLISPRLSGVRVLVVTAREDLAIASGVRAILGPNLATMPLAPSRKR